LTNICFADIIIIKEFDRKKRPSPRALFLPADNISKCFVIGTEVIDLNGYVNMLIEYKQSEAALRERIAQLKDLLKGTLGSMEREDLMRRKLTLEQELYDLLDVISEIYVYAGCGVDEKCKNA